MEDHIKGLLTQHLRQPKHLSCTCNANMKWSTGQSGFARTLRQVIKSTVANMNARQPHQPPQITVHMNENHTKPNSQVSSFRFHKQTVSRFQNNKTPTLCKFRKFMQTSLCRNSAISFQSRIVSHHLVRSNWIQKHIYRSYPTGYRSRSYPTGYRSEVYTNCTANSLMRYSMRPCPSTSSCFKGPYQRYSIGFIF